MDLAMPVLHGLAATKKLREETPYPLYTDNRNQRVLYLWISAGRHDVGFDGYLTKPIDFEKMDDLIKTLLGVK